MTGTASTVVRCRYCAAAGGLCAPIRHRPGCVILAGGWWADAITDLRTRYPEEGAA